MSGEPVPAIRRVRPPLWRRVRAKGFTGTLEAIAARAHPPRVANYQTLGRHFVGMRGLEIGGPSPVFARRGIFPIYPSATVVDNVNFSATTVWDYRPPAGLPPGAQYVLEATQLSGIPSGSYDFVASSHTLEHTANPLKAMQEWKRVIRPRGYLALVVPDKHRTFDHRRPTTTMHHLLADLERDVGEDDLTHVSESELLHDARRDPGELCASVPLARHNFETRVMHHHVFDVHLLEEVVGRAGFEILAIQVVRPFHIFALATCE